jgi:hypothetical protein
MDSGKDFKLKVNILQVMYFTVAAWLQVTQLTIMNSFHKCGYGHELNTQTDLDANMEDDDDDFHDDWIQLGAKKDVNFNAYAPSNNKLAMCRVSSTDDLCDDCEEGRSGEEEEDKCEPKLVPCFTKVHAAFQTVKSFLYMHNTGQCHEENILNIERALSGLKCKFSTKQLSVDLKKKGCDLHTYKITFFIHYFHRPK